MGYGINTQRYRTKKWGQVVRFHVDQDIGANRGNFDGGLQAWKTALGNSIYFTEVQQTNNPEVTVKIYNANYGGNSTWTSPDGLNGRDPNRGGTLHLKDSSTKGTVIHEIGHMLGLGHEQDRQNDEQARQVRRDITFGDRVALSRAQHYRNYGNFDSDSIMLYGSNYQAKTQPSTGDVQTVLAINS